ncbi:MAG: hypothetical protein ACRDRK_16215 [Pseudonocardia sp.]
MSSTTTTTDRQPMTDAAAARIAAAVAALDAELAAAGVPVDARETVLIGLFARLRDERTRPAREAHWRAIAAQRATARTDNRAGRGVTR